MSARCRNNIYLSLALLVVYHQALASSPSNGCDTNDWARIDDFAYTFVVDLSRQNRPAWAEPRMSQDMIRVLYPTFKNNERMIINVHKYLKKAVPAKLVGVHQLESQSCGLSTLQKYMVITDDISEPFHISNSNVIAMDLNALIYQCYKRMEMPEEAFNCVKRYWW